MILSPAITEARSAPTQRSLAVCLPAITAAQAVASRVAFDARFAPWLADVLGRPDITVDAVTSATEASISLELQTAHGRLAFGLKSADWPALQLVAGLAESTLAAAVAGVMLRPLIERLKPALGGASVAAIGSHALPPEAVARLCADELHAMLVACDAQLARRVRGVWQAEQRRIDTAPLGRLRLRGRIVLMQRAWSRQVLRSLAAGDLVLPSEPGMRASQPFIVVGRGIALRATVAFDLKEHAVHIVDAPALEIQAQGAEPGAPPASLDELQLPIGFELDTARVSLAELAGMRPGYAIELDLPLAEAPVRLVCHGQTVGHGQLIAIGDRIGVRITRMSFEDEQPDVH